MSAIASVNLMPAARRMARQRSVRLRRWAVACAAWAVALALGYAAYRASWDPGPADLPQRIDEQHARAQQLQTAIHSQATQLASTTRLLRANAAVEAQPDWSALLAMIANALGEQVVLTSCNLTPTAANDAPRDEAMLSPIGYRVRLRGFGRSQADVSQFSLRLESLELFAAVRVLQTRREPFGAGHAIAFEFDCIIGQEATRP